LEMIEPPDHFGLSTVWLENRLLGTLVT